MSAPLKTLGEIRAAFPALKEGQAGKSRLYADHAATSLKPKFVFARMKKYLEHETANAGRGFHFLAEKISANVEKVRKQTAVFIGAKESSEIIFTRGATDALNLLALSLGERFQPGDEVVVTDLEHHSNFVPWKLLEDRKGIKLRSVSLQKDGSLDLASLKKNLNPKTRLLTITALSNVTGEATPLEEIISLAHQKKNTRGGGRGTGGGTPPAWVVGGGRRLRSILRTQIVWADGYWCPLWKETAS